MEKKQIYFIVNGTETTVTINSSSKSTVLELSKIALEQTGSLNTIDRYQVIHNGERTLNWNEDLFSQGVKGEDVIFLSLKAGIGASEPVGECCGKGGQIDGTFHCDRGYCIHQKGGVKGAEEILLKNLPKDCYWVEMENLTNTPKRFVIQAMEEYASQFQQKDQVDTQQPQVDEKQVYNKAIDEAKAFLYTKYITSLVRLDDVLNELTTLKKP